MRGPAPKPAPQSLQRRTSRAASTTRHGCSVGSSTTTVARTSSCSVPGTTSYRAHMSCHARSMLPSIAWIAAVTSGFRRRLIGSTVGRQGADEPSGTGGRRADHEVRDGALMGYISPMRKTRSLLAVAALALAACSSSDDGSEGTTATTTTTTVVDRTYPGDAWATVDPGEAGFDAAGLGHLAAEAEAAGSSCLVVTRDGEVVDEHYWQGTTADTPRQAWSVTKSLTSTLVGIAQDQGDLAITDPAADHIPEWQGTDVAAVTVEDL